MSVERKYKRFKRLYDLIYKHLNRLLPLIEWLGFNADDASIAEWPIM